MSKPVHKVTIYMTPEQWDVLSKWSIQRAPVGGELATWLHLSHECNKHAELLELQKSIRADLEPYNVHVDLYE